VEGSGPEELAPAGASSERARVLLALAALAAFGIVVAAVAVTAGGEDEASSAPAAPAECLEAWNGDRDALAFARHNSIFHNYNSAQVGYLEPSAKASVSDDPGAGDCVVVFPRNQLDPEPLAAGQLLTNRGWVPLIEAMDVNAVARLQSEAFDGANAEPTIEGEIAASGGPAEPAADG
jgi:hypothetical protein